MAEPKPTAGKDADIEAGKGLAWLAYFGILFLVPMLANKDNKFSQFHAKQGMWLFIVEIVWWLIIWILTLVFTSVAMSGNPLAFGSWSGMWAVVSIIGLLSLLGWLFFLIMAIMGIIKAATGKYWRMPILGGFVKGDYPV
jgi:uncharacterized membrane protein